MEDMYSGLIDTAFACFGEIFSLLQSTAAWSNANFSGTGD